jgi:tetratricopeptide (TPR) repeat protein
MPDAPDRTLWYWIAVALIPLPVLVRGVRNRPRRVRVTAADAPLRALATSGATDAPRVRGALRTALVARLGGSVMPWAEPGALRRAFRHLGMTEATIDEALTMLARMDDAAYGTATAALANAGPRALALYLKIDEEARAIRRARSAKRTGVAAIFVLFAGSLLAQDALSPRAFFERGVQAYLEGNAAAAASDFFDAARAAPASAAAWANAGTASWEAADTARAVVGWQRALRLDPLDDGARRLLTLVGADAGAAHTVVWPIPRRIPAWVGILLWTGGWVALWRKRRLRVAHIALALGATCMGVSTVHHMRLADKRVGVVSSPAPLRSLPAMGAEAGITPLTGELVRVTDVSGVWVYVTGSSARDGWIDAARILDLDGRPLRN